MTTPGYQRESVLAERKERVMSYQTEVTGIGAAYQTLDE